MAKVTLHPAFNTLSGTQGGLVYRNTGGQIVMARRPRPSKRKPSAAQLQQRERFAAAGRYARKVLADPCQLRAYEALARERNRRADKLVASDFLTPPVVDAIDLSGYRGEPGGLIRVLATDDIEVVSVHVAVHTAAGVKLEEGLAGKLHGVWRYLTTAARPGSETLTITATATDRPGHHGTARIAYP